MGLNYSKSIIIKILRKPLCLAARIDGDFWPILNVFFVGVFLSNLF